MVGTFGISHWMCIGVDITIVCTIARIYALMYKTVSRRQERRIEMLRLHGRVTRSGASVHVGSGTPERSIFPE